MTKIRIDELGLSVRAYNCIRRAGIDTVEELVERADNGTLHIIRGIGKKCFEEILNKLEEKNVRKIIAGVVIMALVSIPNMSGYKSAISALGKLQTSGVKVETGYKPVIPPASDVYDPENPLLYPREYNY